MDATLSLLIMRQALQGVADSLTLYRHHVDNPDFLQSVLSFMAECKQCAITPKALADTAAAPLLTRLAIAVQTLSVSIAFASAWAVTLSLAVKL